MRSLLYADYLVYSFVVSTMVGRFVEVSRRRGLKVNADTSNVMVLGG